MSSALPTRDGLAGYYRYGPRSVPQLCDDSLYHVNISDPILHDSVTKRVGDRVVKQFRVPAGNQELILAAFEEMGWPPHIDDPLPPVHDLDPKLLPPAGLASDEREYHFGLKRADGGQKLLYRLLEDGGIQAVRDAYWLGKSSAGGSERPVLITGGFHGPGFDVP